MGFRAQIYKVDRQLWDREAYLEALEIIPDNKWLSSDLNIEIEIYKKDDVNMY